MNFLGLLASIAGKKFTEELPPVIEAIKKDPVKGILQTAYDIAAPLPLQAALYSPEAEAAYIGVNGFKRLMAAGGPTPGMATVSSPFLSRYFAQHGPRYELNPTPVALVQNMMQGGPATRFEELAKKQEALTAKWQDLYERTKVYPASKGLKQAEKTAYKEMAALNKTTVHDILGDTFPDIFKAYPELKKMPVAQANYGTTKAFYKPVTENENWGAAEKQSAQAKTAFMKAMRNDMSIPVTELMARRDKVGQMIKARAEQQDALGFMKLGPADATSAVPANDMLESLMHEIQHFIQRREMPQVATASPHEQSSFFLKAYQNQEKRVADGLDATWRPGDDLYPYKVNPYEREAREAAGRDVNLSKRAAGRPTEAKSFTSPKQYATPADLIDNMRFTNPNRFGRSGRELRDSREAQELVASRILQELRIK